MVEINENKADRWAHAHNAINDLLEEGRLHHRIDSSDQVTEG